MPKRLIGTTVGVLVDGTRVLILDTRTGQVHAEHPLVAPGEASVLDEHYGGAGLEAPVRAIRPRSAAEKEFCSLGPAALERATAFGRWRAANVRSILAAGTGVPTPRPPGTRWYWTCPLPMAAGRSLAEYAPTTKAASS